MGLDTVSTPKDEVLYAKEETTFGTLVYAAGTDLVPIFGDGVAASFKQPKGKFPDPQKQLTVSQLSRLAGGYSPGEFSFPMLIKPSGALGTPIKGAAILKALFGVQTTTGSTSDVFTLGGINDDPIGLSFIHRLGHRVTWNSGCVVNKVTFPVKAGNSLEAIGQCQVSGQFCKQIQAGYSYVNHAGGYVATNTEIIVDDDTVFDVGAKIQFRNATTGAVIDNNSGAGFTISAINASTHTLTISALAETVADDSIVDGFTPTVSDAGTEVFGRLGYAQECVAAGALANISIIDAQIEFDNGFKIKDDEKSGTWWPITAIRAANRQVLVTVNKVFTKTGVAYFAEANASTLKHISLPVGDTAAYRYRFDLPTIDFDTPDISGGDELGVGRSGVALASSSYDDEISLTFD